MACYKDKFLWFVMGMLALVKIAMLAYLYYQNPLGEQVLIFPDSLSYIYPAQTLLTYGQFWEAISVNPLLLRTPGYPVFLAGVQLITGNLTWAVAVFQNLLTLSLLIPVYLTTRGLAGRQAARASILFTAASVLYFSLSFAVLTEVLCATLLAWFVYLFANLLKSWSTRQALGAACFLAAAIYVRPAAYYYAGLASLLLICLQRTRWKQILVAFVLPLVLSLGIWHARNFITTGYAGFSTVNAYNLYFWNEDFVAKQYQISIPQAHDYLQKSLPQNMENYTPKEQTKIYRQLALPWLKAGWSYKLLQAPRWAAKTLLGTNFIHTSRLLLGHPAQEQELAFETLNQTKNLHATYLQTKATKVLLALSLLQVVLMILFAMIGLLKLYPLNPKAALFLGSYCLYFWGIGSVFFGAYARFRAPFEFVLCLLAGVGAFALLEKLQTKRQRIN